MFRKFRSGIALTTYVIEKSQPKRETALARATACLVVINGLMGILLRAQERVTKIRFWWLSRRGRDLFVRIRRLGNDLVEEGDVLIPAALLRGGTQNSFANFNPPPQSKPHAEA